MRPIPPGDRDFERLYRRRNDAENINRHLDDTLWLRRAHSIGHLRQTLNVITYALGINALALHLHRQRHVRQPPDSSPAPDEPSGCPRPASHITHRTASNPARRSPEPSKYAHTPGTGHEHDGVSPTFSSGPAPRGRLETLRPCGRKVCSPSRLRETAESVTSLAKGQTFQRTAGATLCRLLLPYPIPALRGEAHGLFPERERVGSFQLVAACTRRPATGSTS